MGFTVTQGRYGSFDAIIAEDPSSGAELMLLPELGGTVQRLKLATDDGTETLSLLQSDSIDELSENPWFRGRFLFPFNDRIAVGRYHFEGTEYQLPINDTDHGDAIHGFLYRTAMNVDAIKSDNDTARIQLSVTLPKIEGYPFSPSLTLSFTLERNSLLICAEISNTSTGSIPVSFGWHPYFSFPQLKSIDECHLHVTANHYVEVDDALIPTGNIRSVHDTAFDYMDSTTLDSQELDICFVQEEGITELRWDDLSLQITQSTSFFPYTQIFTLPDRSAIALEPVTAAANAFNTMQTGSVILEPKQRRKGSFILSLHKVSTL